MDVRMPDMDGYEVCRKLKAQPETEDIPIVFLSVASDVEDKVRAFQTGGVDYITKPIQPEEVIARVETHPRLHAMEKALGKSERQLAEIIDFLPNPTFAIDLERRDIIWNKAIEQMTGIRAEDMLGKGAYEYALPLYGERRPVLLDLVLERNEDIEQRYLAITEQGPQTLVSESYHPKLKPGGAFIWATATPLFDNEGNVVGAIEPLKDITDRVRTQEALQHGE